MSGLQQRVQDAFDAIELPDGLKERTLAAIAQLPEGLSAGQGSDVAPGAPGARRAADSPEAPGTVRQGKLAEPRGDAPCPGQRPAAPDGSRQGRAAAPRPRRFRAWRIALAAAACLALCAVGAFGLRLYAEPTAYVGIDVNPSLELALNRFDIVVGATAANDDGERVLADVQLVGKAYGDALDDLAQSAEFSRYATGDAYVQISVTCSDERQAGALQGQSDSCLQGLGCQGSCAVVDEDTREAARAAGMGVGRYQAALRLMELDPTVTLEMCRSLSMRELHDRIAQAGQGTGSEDGHAATGSEGRHAAGEGGHSRTRKVF